MACGADRAVLIDGSVKPQLWGHGHFAEGFEAASEFTGISQNEDRGLSGVQPAVRRSLKIVERDAADPFPVGLEIIGGKAVEFDGKPAPDDLSGRLE